MSVDQAQVGALPRGGDLVSAISDAMVRLHCQQFGRGPASARAVVVEDTIVCILSDVYTPVEKTLLRVGKEDSVRDTRLMHQRAMETEFVAPIEELTGRRVSSFCSSVTFDPDQAIEVFTLVPTIS